MPASPGAATQDDGHCAGDAAATDCARWDFTAALDAETIVRSCLAGLDDGPSLPLGFGDPVRQDQGGETAVVLDQDADYEDPSCEMVDLDDDQEEAPEITDQRALGTSEAQSLHRPDTKHRARRKTEEPADGGDTTSAASKRSLRSVSKNLRAISLSLVAKIRAREEVTSTDISNELAREAVAMVATGGKVTREELAAVEKNIRRRLYDSLKVLVSVGAIRRGRSSKTLTWNGVSHLVRPREIAGSAPSSTGADAEAITPRRGRKRANHHDAALSPSESHSESADALPTFRSAKKSAPRARKRTRLMNDVSIAVTAARRRIRAKAAELKLLTVQELALTSICARNSREPASKRPVQPSGSRSGTNTVGRDSEQQAQASQETTVNGSTRVQLPFLLVRTPDATDIKLVATDDARRVSFEFSDRFQIVNDTGVVSRVLGMSSLDRAHPRAQGDSIGDASKFNECHDKENLKDALLRYKEQTAGPLPGYMSPRCTRAFSGHGMLTVDPTYPVTGCSIGATSPTSMPRTWPARSVPCIPCESPPASPAAPHRTATDDGTAASHRRKRARGNRDDVDGARSQLANGPCASPKRTFKVERQPLPTVPSRLPPSTPPRYPPTPERRRKPRVSSKRLESNASVSWRRAEQVSNDISIVAAAAAAAAAEAGVDLPAVLAKTFRPAPKADPQVEGTHSPMVAPIFPTTLLSSRRTSAFPPPSKQKRASVGNAKASSRPSCPSSTAVADNAELRRTSRHVEDYLDNSSQPTESKEATIHQSIASSFVKSEPAESAGATSDEFSRNPSSIPQNTAFDRQPDSPKHDMDLQPWRNCYPTADDVLDFSDDNALEAIPGFTPGDEDLLDMDFSAPVCE